MMDGRNCTGRTISLLNDSGAAIPAKSQLPTLVPHSRSPSSCASTPSFSPETPHLVRSSSSDSRSYTTPSPTTPSYASFDGAPNPFAANQTHQQYYLVNPAYSKMDHHAPSMYPPPPDANSAIPYPAPPPQMSAQAVQPQIPNSQIYRTSTSPGSEPSRVSTVSAASNAKQQPKKNQYPCPMAKAFACNDFFTTSGHAARHAKKHTGKKDAFCPECNKAFTRKDNMEQHRRTHQNGRGASRTNGDDSKVRKSSKQSSKRPPKPDAHFEAAVEQQLTGQAQQAAQAVQAQAQAQVQVQQQTQQSNDHAMMIPALAQPAGPYFMDTLDSGPIASLPMAMPDMTNMRPPLHRSSMVSSLDYIAPVASMVDPETMQYSYPSPNLSNGLNSLALAADVMHRLLPEDKSSSRSPTHATPSASP